jgi:hypothetical protein
MNGECCRDHKGSLAHFSWYGVKMVWHCWLDAYTMAGLLSLHMESPPHGGRYA